MSVRIQEVHDQRDEALKIAVEALDGLHESLFIGSERGLSNTTLREMASHAKATILAVRDVLAAPVPVRGDEQ